MSSLSSLSSASRRAKETTDYGAVSGPPPASSSPWMHHADSAGSKRLCRTPPPRPRSRSHASVEIKLHNDDAPGLENTRPSLIKRDKNDDDGDGKKNTLAHCLIYAAVNVIIAVPGMYGYAAVIFNHPAFQGQMNALAKLVVFSSCIHQAGFVLFSGLSFAIGTVQDAGLIFLSAMANDIANKILDGGGTIDEVVSTTLVVLPLGTAALGLVLIVLGKFRLLDIVSYLPLPVVGGYLAFIGYFCLMAGVALCISKPMTTLSDWAYLLEPDLLLLSLPGLLAALLFTILSRKATNDAALPLAMVLVPAAFYLVLALTGNDLQSARDGGWVGQEAPPVPVQDLFRLVDFKLVHWSLIKDCIGTWIGMVFVVSFASCLDVAAVSMDMGEALDVNREMVTVGTCNVMSGLLFGFTGSYIFSQTIFTYRTGCHSRYVGVFIMIAFLAVCASTINMLQISPLFFLGATLIFIGYDLMWEWLVEIRHKIFLREYAVLLLTFVAIQIWGMDFGIVLGIVIALFDHVASTNHVSSVKRVLKRSRAVWKKTDSDMLQAHGYDANDPKIVTLEVSGSIFFGSSQKLLQEIMDDIGLAMTNDERIDASHASPHVSTPLCKARVSPNPGTPKSWRPIGKIRPRYVILDLAQMHNLDASAASSCFLQLAKMCEKRGIFLCAAAPVPRVEWILRSHDVAYSFDEEAEIKQSGGGDASAQHPTFDKLVLFLTIFEALEFSERLLLRRLSPKRPQDEPSLLHTHSFHQKHGLKRHQLTSLFDHVLRDGLSETDKDIVDGIKPYYEEVTFSKGENVFVKDTHSDAFFVILHGEIAVPRYKKGGVSSTVLSGAGKIKPSGSLSNFFGIHKEGDISGSHVESFHKVGGVFGYCDFLLQRNRSFEVLASCDGTILAKFTQACMDQMKVEDVPLYAIVQNLLFHECQMDLANCTCQN